MIPTLEFLKQRISDYNSIMYLLKQNPGISDIILIGYARLGDIKNFKIRLTELTDGYEHLSKESLRDMARERGISPWDKSKRKLIMEILGHDSSAGADSTTGRIPNSGQNNQQVTQS